MNILLVSPRSSEKKPPIGFRIPQLALQILSALVPKEDSLEVIDEQLDEVDFNKEYDLVGISIMTATAKRGYYIARRFREKGSKVVFGGIHASVLPEESIQYGDAVLIGEAEGVWPTIIEDAKNGRLKKFYYAPPFDLNYAPLPRRDIGLDRSILGYRWPGIYTTRGCPYRCEFCSVSDIYGSEIRHLPIPLVLDDIKHSRAKLFLFLDDNVIADPRYAKSLFQALAPLKIEWGGQSTISIALDKELLKLCHKSGCQGLFIGLESVSRKSMRKFRKTFKTIKETEDAVKRVQDAGILFHPSFVFGLDDDTEAVFDDTLKFLYRNRITTATFNILTPYPGTRLYQRLKREDRIITEDWNLYNHSTVVFRPRNMSAQKLAENYFQLKKEFYSWSNTAHRLFNLNGIAHCGLAQFFYALFNNIAGHKTLVDSYNGIKLLKSIF